MRLSYIYSLNCPITKEIKYIGKSQTKPKQRLASHLASSKKAKKPNKREAWIKSLLNKNLRPTLNIIIELNTEDVDLLDFMEIDLINYFQELGYDVKNGQPGGDGQPCGYKFKKRHISPKGVVPWQLKPYQKGRPGSKWTEEQRIKFSNSSKGLFKKQKNSKSIFIKNLKTNKIKKYPYMSFAARKLKVSASRIQSVLQKKTFRFKHYTASYNRKFPYNKIHNKKVIAFNNNKRLKFNSIMSASRFFKIKRDSIYFSLNNKTKLKGFYWRRNAS